MEENSGESAADGLNWLPEISEYEVTGVVCVAGKNPGDEKVLKYCMVTKNGEGCQNLVPVAMIAAKPEEVIGRRRYQSNLAAIRCRLGV